MAGTFTPYTTGAALFGTKPTWIPSELDQQRIMSYQLYEEIYWNVPDIFKLSLRGTNELPLYVPSGRTIVDTTDRYVAPQFGLSYALLTTDGGVGASAPAAAANAMEAWLRRERFRSKFAGNKLYGLIRGDACWHITADPLKPEGSRISITAIDPGMYFPITSDEDVELILGVHLVETITTPDGDRIRRLTYRYTERNAAGVRGVTVEDGIFELDKWNGPTDAPEQVIMAPTLLPPEITQLPVYHFKNFDEPGNPFGSSEMRGLERLMSALNQTLSDEDLTLALEGIGMYATDSSQPIDPVTRKPVPWQLGPGRVVHYDGEKWDRVEGPKAINDSYGAHYDRIWEAMKQASSTPDIAIGKVDVQVAMSGVSLQLQLGPMLAKAGKKNVDIIDVHTQMFYDLSRMWWPAYEGQDLFSQVVITPVMGDPVPVDREKRFAELNDMLDRGVIDTAYYRSEAKKLGYVFPDNIGTTADAEFAKRNTQADPFAERAAGDLTDDGAA